MVIEKHKFVIQPKIDTTKKGGLKDSFRRKVIYKKQHKILEKYSPISLKTLIKSVKKNMNKQNRRNMKLQKKMKYEIKEIEIMKHLRRKIDAANRVSSN